VSLTRRLFFGSLVVLGTLVVAVMLIAGARLRDRLVAEKTDELTRDARLVAFDWRRQVDADSLARRAGEALGYRVTLIDSSGAVTGDSEFHGDARRRLENHLTRPEVMSARTIGVGRALRRSASAGDEELYVAVRHPLGYVRVSLAVTRLDMVVAGARRDVLVSGLIALVGALVLSVVFARTITRPVVELRDVARAIAAGDLSGRPALTAPGEVGDLAIALHRMSELLGTRLAALEADDHLMTAVMESLEEGVLAVDARGSVLRINARARGLFKLSAPVPFPRERLPRHRVIQAAVDHALSGRVMATEEASLDGRTVALASRPLAAGGGVVTVLDLTVLRRLETIRRDFVANVSHELKTPLTAVTGFAETLLDEDIPPAQRRVFVETIRANAGRMQRIVDDLLDLSRIESGGWHPKVGRLDVRDAVRDVLMTMQSAAEAKGLRLELEVAPDAAQVHADPTAFHQIVSNLVENAIRYTHEGSARLRTRRGIDGVWVEVRDTGVGIAPEHLPRIFERFYRVDSARSREQGGTGLGLAIVRHLAEAHGGRVEAESAPGRGTTISVLFPDGATPRS
jgi:two-component system phosphate regulon sensor histidine kinase PhoR